MVRPWPEIKYAQADEQKTPNRGSTFFVTAAAVLKER